MTKKAVWISYDFGLKGDFTGLYTWLDENEATECGHSLAFLSWSAKNPTNLVNEIEHSIKESVKLSKSDRIYVIWKNEDDSIKGKFINGSRRQSPWEGYSSINKKAETDTGE